MRLYRSTNLWFLKNGGTTLTEGLKPAMEKQAIEQLPHGVDWPTSQAECNFATHEPECCIRLFIPNNDKRLVRWETWLRQHDEQEILSAAERTSREHGIPGPLVGSIIPPSGARRNSSKQVCDPHNSDHVPVIVRLLFCVLVTGPDKILLGCKGLSLLLDPKLPFSDVADHGIHHRGASRLRSWLYDDITQLDALKTRDNRWCLSISAHHDTRPRRRVCTCDVCGL
jgi:hypothetical protein